MNAPYRKLFLALSLFSSGNCLADWTGGIEAGARIGSDRPVFRLFAKNDNDVLSHYAYLDWIRESGGSHYRIGYNPTFRVSHSVYSFGRFSIEQDNPGEVEREIDALVGIGNNLFRRGNTQIKVETGIGGRLLRFDGEEDDTDGFFFLAGSMSSSILSLLRFNAAVNTKAGPDQTTIDGEAKLSIPIAPGTTLSYVYNVKRYDVEGKDTFNNKDSFFKINYGF